MTNTTLQQYNALRLAIDYFKSVITERDNDSLYTKLVDKTVVDYDATKKNKELFTEQFEKFEELWEEYKQQNLEEFSEVLAIDNSDNGLIKVKDLDITLEEAYQGYLFANREIKAYKKGGQYCELLPKYSTYRSLAEFKEKHDTVKKEIRLQLGLPETDEVFTVYKEVTKRDMNRPKKKDIEDATDEVFNIYLAEFEKTNNL